MKDVIERLPRKEIIPTLAVTHDALASGGELLVETGYTASAIRARFAKNASHLMSNWLQRFGWTCLCLCTRSDFSVKVSGSGLPAAVQISMFREAVKRSGLSLGEP